jgi:hypothetical protein
MAMELVLFHGVIFYPTPAIGSDEQWSLALIGPPTETLSVANAPNLPQGPPDIPTPFVWLPLTRIGPGDINPRITRSPLERKSPSQDTVVCISPRCAAADVLLAY